MTPSAGRSFCCTGVAVCPRGDQEVFAHFSLLISHYTFRDERGGGGGSGTGSVDAADGRTEICIARTPPLSQRWNELLAWLGRVAFCLNVK